MIPGIGLMVVKKKGASLKTNLASHFSAEETSGSTAYDSHGGNNGTIYNCTLNQTGKIGKCFSYNGSNSRIIIPDSSIYDNNGNITFNVWVRFASVSSTRAIFAFSVGSSGGVFRLQLSLGTLNMLFCSSYEAWPPTTLGLLSPSLNTWYMITAVIENIFDGSYKQRGTGYVNGSYVTSAERNQTDGNWDMSPIQNPTIGASDNSYFFSGLIDEVSFWTKSLSPADITLLYNSGNGLSYTNW